MTNSLVLVDRLGGRDDVLVRSLRARPGKRLSLRGDLAEVDDRIGVLVRIVAVEPGPDDDDAVLTAGQEIPAGGLRQVENLRVGGRGRGGEREPDRQSTKNFHSGSPYFHVV